MGLGLHRVLLAAPWPPDRLLLFALPSLEFALWLQASYWDTSYHVHILEGGRHGVTACSQLCRYARLGRTFLEDPSAADYAYNSWAVLCAEKPRKVLVWLDTFLPVAKKGRGDRQWRAATSFCLAFYSDSC